jgi:hypothetical protein
MTAEEQLDIVRSRIRKRTAFTRLSNGQVGAMFVGDGVNANYECEDDAFDAMLLNHFGIEPKHRHVFKCVCGEKHS